MDKKLIKRIKEVIELLEEDQSSINGEIGQNNYELAEFARHHLPVTLFAAERVLQIILRES